MKRLLLTLLLPLLGIASANAAPTLNVKPQNSIFPVGDIEGFTLSGKNSIYFVNKVDRTSDVIVTALDSSNQVLWTRTIDAGGDEVATAATVDAIGNIWLAGAMAPVIQIETSTVPVVIDNPDQVNVDDPSQLRADMTTLTLWKLAPTGELLATQTSEMSSVPLISAVSVNSSGASVVGILNNKPFALSANNAGVFGKIVTLGSEKTAFNDVQRGSDGSLNIYGSSSETLLKKKLAGKRDGILMTINKAGVITQLVRSSAPQALREWQSASQINVTTGSVVTGKVIETAITQFTKTYSPTWTLRIPSTGQSRITSINGVTYLALTSKSAITGITGWKPLAPSLLIIAFDSKGVMKGAYSFPGLITPIALTSTRDGGVVGAGRAADSTVSIFRLTSR